MKSKAARFAVRRTRRSWNIPKKTGAKTKLALLVFMVLLLIIFFGIGSKFLGGIFGPIIVPTARSYYWDGSFTVNILLKNDQITVLSFDPNQNLVKLLSIPGELLVSVPGGYGNWQLKSVDGLGEQEGKGMELVKGSVADTLGMPIDGFIMLEGSFEDKPAKDIIDSLRNPLSLPALLLNLKTDLSPVELVKLFWGVRSVRFDKVDQYDLAEDFLEHSTLADGSEIFISDPGKADALSQKLADQSLLEESLSVAVFNSTTYPGLAQKVARVVTNMGGRVIITGNTPDQSDKTIIRSQKEWQNSKTSRRLKDVFGATIEDLDCQDAPNCDTIICRLMRKSTQCILDDKISSSRADINLILGEDFMK